MDKVMVIWVNLQWSKNISKDHVNQNTWVVYIQRQSNIILPHSQCKTVWSTQSLSLAHRDSICQNKDWFKSCIE